jgi:hypothetical protein
MKTSRFLLLGGGAPAAIAFQTASGRLRAESLAPSALGGQVTSTEEGPMEGVVVSAEKDGSTIGITSIKISGKGREALS